MSQLSLTIPESLQLRAESHAQKEGVPLEAFIACALAEKVAILDASAFLRERAKAVSREEFAAILAKVPDVEPEEYDRLSPDLDAALRAKGL